VEHKVPTQLAYTTTRKKNTTWGFEVPTRPSRRTIIEKYFKLLLDRDLLAPKPLLADQTHESDDDAALDIEDVKQWFTDFLGAVYDWINRYLEKELRVSLKSTKVEYIFSVPTTWNEVVVTDYQEIIRNAGYGKVAGHTARIGLTEAEAAAVYSAVYDAKNGERWPGEYQVYMLLRMPCTS
jgi:hypothetical protein